MNTTEKESSKILVSVAMCTYKRDHVVKTIDSVAKLHLNDEYKIEIIVVDNDPKTSARERVALSIQKYRHLKIKYISEPRKNISHARNACIENSSGEWIAFIDDDEVADENWLSNLLISAHKYKADVVLGRVVPIYPESTPQWIIDGNFFQRKRLPTGSELTSCGGGTTLLNAKALGSLRFDPIFGLTGGEDVDLFHRVHLQGAKIIYSDEAFLYEPVEEKRLNFKYLWSRRYGIGMSYVSYRLPNQNTAQKITSVTKNVLAVLVLSSIYVLSIIRKKHKRIKILLKIADQFGKISSHLKIKAPERY